jgi:hypothetical protein
MNTESSGVSDITVSDLLLLAHAVVGLCALDGDLDVDSSEPMLQIAQRVIQQLPPQRLVPPIPDDLAERVAYYRLLEGQLEQDLKGLRSLREDVEGYYRRVRRFAELRLSAEEALRRQLKGEPLNTATVIARLKKAGFNHISRDEHNYTHHREGFTASKCWDHDHVGQVEVRHVLEGNRIGLTNAVRAQLQEALGRYKTALEADGLIVEIGERSGRIDNPDLLYVRNSGAADQEKKQGKNDGTT